MKKSFVFGACMLGLLPIQFGAGPLVVQNADFIRVQGSGPVQLKNGTLLQETIEDGQWSLLLSRNKNVLKIELSVDEGQYVVESWSIASDPMNPNRTYHSETIVVGDGGGGQPTEIVGSEHVLELVAAWGPCNGACPYDFNGDGEVAIMDLLHLLTIWGQPLNS